VLWGVLVITEHGHRSCLFESALLVVHLSRHVVVTVVHRPVPPATSGVES